MFIYRCFVYQFALVCFKQFLAKPKQMKIEMNVEFPIANIWTIDQGGTEFDIKVCRGAARLRNAEGGWAIVVTGPCLLGSV